MREGTSMHRRSHRRLAAFAFLSFVPVLIAVAEEGAPAPAKGDLWETTSQMSMEGAPMALPVQKMKVCAKKDEPPVSADERHKCTNSDFKKDGPKVSWKTSCGSDMTGEGEITYTDADNY